MQDNTHNLDPNSDAPQSSANADTQSLPDAQPNEVAPEAGVEAPGVPPLPTDSEDITPSIENPLTSEVASLTTESNKETPNQVEPPFDWEKEKKWTYKDGFDKPRHQIGYRDTPGGRVVFERGKPCKGVETDTGADWTGDMSRVQRVPYNANKVCVSKLLLFVESEATANFVRNQLDKARRAEPDERKKQQLRLIVATTMSGGPGHSHLTALGQYLSHLKGVSVFPANDDAGRDHANDICRACSPLVKFTKMVELPDLPPSGGVKDFFRAGGTLYELFALIKAAPLWTPSSPTDDDAGREFISSDGQVPPENDAKRTELPTLSAFGAK